MNSFLKAICLHLVLFLKRLNFYELSLGEVEGAGGKGGVQQNFISNEKLCLGQDATIRKLSNFCPQK